jgi:hypothetical protein
MPMIIGGSVVVAYVLAGWLGLNEWVYIWTKGLYHTYQALFLATLALGLVAVYWRQRTTSVSWTRRLLAGALVGFGASAVALLVVPLFMAGGVERFAAVVRDPGAYARAGAAALGSGGWLVGLGAAWLAHATLIRHAGRARVIVAIAILGGLVQATALLVRQTLLLRF